MMPPFYLRHDGLGSEGLGRDHGTRLSQETVRVHHTLLLQMFQLNISHNGQTQ